ncbi:MAG: hypothetical protein JWQ27_222 [Ferruginibacter sp.]|nr:hypothetical protein [Ferruginibacter sp.]
MKMKNQLRVMRSDKGRIRTVLSERSGQEKVVAVTVDDASRMMAVAYARHTRCCETLLRVPTKGAYLQVAGEKQDLPAGKYAAPR